MADPTGSNLTSSQVQRIDHTDPVRKEFNLGDRLKALRSDLDLTLSGTVTVANGQTAHDEAVTGLTSAMVGKPVLATLDDSNASSATDYVKWAKVYNDGGTIKLKITVNANPGHASGQKVHFFVDAR